MPTVAVMEGARIVSIADGETELWIPGPDCALLLPEGTGWTIEEDRWAERRVRIELPERDAGTYLLFDSMVRTPYEDLPKDENGKRLPITDALCLDLQARYGDITATRAEELDFTDIIFWIEGSAEGMDALSLWAYRGDWFVRFTLLSSNREVDVMDARHRALLADMMERTLAKYPEEHKFASPGPTLRTSRNFNIRIRTNTQDAQYLEVMPVVEGARRPVCIIEALRREDIPKTSISLAKHAPVETFTDDGGRAHFVVDVSDWRIDVHSQPNPDAWALAICRAVVNEVKGNPSSWPDNSPNWFVREDSGALLYSMAGRAYRLTIPEGYREIDYENTGTYKAITLESEEGRIIQLACTANDAETAALLKNASRDDAGLDKNTLRKMAMMAATELEISFEERFIAAVHKDGFLDGPYIVIRDSSKQIIMLASIEYERGTLIELYDESGSITDSDEAMLAALLTAVE